MYIIFHSRDLDGFSSGAIGKRYYPNATLIPWDYGEPIPEIPEGESLIVVDVSFPMEQMEKYAQGRKMLWVDHHASSIKEYEEYFEGESSFDAYIKIGKAACELMWEYLYPKEEMPLAIQLLGSYDVWRNENKEYWDKLIVPFQYGMRLKCNSVDTFPMILFGTDDQSNPTEESVEFARVTFQEGKLVLAYQKTMNQNACKCAFEATIKGYRAICLNVGGANSQVFDSVWDPEKYDLMVPFIWTGKFWKASLYTTKTDIDCSVIAKSLGGGGHKQAAGFEIDDIFVILKQ